MKFGRGYFITVFSVVLFAASSASADRIDVRTRKTGKSPAKVLDQTTRPAPDKKTHPLVKKALEVEADTKISIDDRFMAIQDLLNEYEKAHDLSKKARAERVKDPIWAAIDEVSHRIYKQKYPESAGSGNGSGATNLMQRAVSSLMDNNARLEVINNRMKQINTEANEVRRIFAEKGASNVSAEDVKRLEDLSARLLPEYQRLFEESADLLAQKVNTIDGVFSGNAKP